MSKFESTGIRIDQGTSMNPPHMAPELDGEAIAAVQFKYDFAMSCAAEARTFPVGSPEHKENLCFARDYLDAALEATPNNPQFHFSRAIVSAELEDYTAAVTSLRNAMMYDPSEPGRYITVLQLGSEELNKVSPRSISPTTIKIQSHISDGDFHTAFRAAHAEINRCIERDAKPNLWDVQLMRVAAMQIGNERIYVDTLNVLEQRGVLDADEPEYLPVGYTITERMRQEMKDEATAEGEDPARSQLFAKLETHDISPIDKTAVRVGAKKVPGA